jgi:hypothetical protein
MFTKTAGWLLAILFLLASHTNAQQPSSVKKITITVIDGSTGKAIVNAEVRLRGVLLGNKKKNTDVEGKAFFEITPLLSTIKVEITDGVAHKTYSTEIPVNNNQNDYTVAARLEPNYKKIVITARDASNKPIPNATITVLNENRISDDKGTISFNVSLAENLKKLPVTVSRTGYKPLSFTIDIDQNPDQQVQAVSMEKLTSSGESYDMAGPTSTGINTAIDPGYVPPPPKANASVIPLWGPYTPQCSVSPITEVPEYSSFFVEDEKDLLDYVGESCLGTASDAVNSLADLMTNIEKTVSDFRSVFSSFRSDPSSQMFTNAKKVADENAASLQKAGKDSYDKGKALYEAMQKFAGGPELYALNCMWSGMKKFAEAQPGGKELQEMNKIKKTSESFEKATKAMQDKLKSIQDKLSSGASLTSADQKLFTDWSDVQSNVEATNSGLNLLVAYISDPKKLMPYDMQAEWALSAAESMASTLITDCQIRECDKKIKEGIAAGQKSLAAARKYKAQMTKNESKWRQRVNDYMKIGWENMSGDDPRLAHVKPQWENWAKYHNEKIDAENKIENVEKTLTKLGELCTKLQSIAPTLNERVNKYERIYLDGLIAAEKCEFGKAESFLQQLQQAENSSCGHFFPKPYNITKSQELRKKIDQWKKDQKCNVKNDAGETRYGPFTVGLDSWVATGVALKKGQSFRVAVDPGSKMTYAEEGTGKIISMSPDGHGYWNWYVLAAKLAGKITHVGSTGGGYATEDGSIELGAPRTANIYPDDAKGISGGWQVYIYVRNNK